jgi:uncharacterized protein (UPF0147 family)
MLYNETILETLSLIEEDLTVPRNVRTKIKAVISLVVEENGVSAGVKRDKILQHLEDLSSDSNLPAFTRTQIFHVVSNLESKQ